MFQDSVCWCFHLCSCRSWWLFYYKRLTLLAIIVQVFFNTLVHLKSIIGGLISVFLLFLACDVWNAPQFITSALILFIFMRIRTYIRLKYSLMVRIVGIIFLGLLINWRGNILILRFSMDLALFNQFLEIRASLSIRCSTWRMRHVITYSSACVLTRFKKRSVSARWAPFIR